MMKRSSSSSSCHKHPLNIVMDETEFQVAEILLDIPDLISESERFHLFSFTWGAKSKRSSKAEIPTFSSLKSSSLQSPPSAPEHVAAVGPTCETEKPKALSPATPLLFSPSESDEKSKHSKRKVSLKRKREECLRKIQELTERKEFFKEEIKNVQRYYYQQKILNYSLKARKQMLILGLQRDESQSRSRLNHVTELAQPTVQFGSQIQPQQSSYIVDHPPLIMNDTAHTNESSQLAYDQTVSLGVGLFDLNLLPEESSGIERGQPLKVVVADKNEIRALAAQARHRRIQICRSKNPNVASKLRYPLCR